ncbi:MAG: CPBP family intramembrane metalloprotease [Erysipelotrichaceae bacterium]|nr:CPBP family intramembrane metalloprotease [Erysipelotrichaceae bacterium]
MRENPIAKPPVLIPSVPEISQGEGSNRTIEKCLSAVWVYLAVQLSLSGALSFAWGWLVSAAGSLLNYEQLYQFLDALSGIESLVITVISGGVAAFFAFSQLKINLNSLLEPKKLKPSFFLWGPLVTCALYLPLAFGSGLLQILLGFFGLTVPEVGQPMGTTLVSNICYFVSAVMAAPLLEELIFRGVILNSLKKFSPFFALVFSSLLFAAAHLNLYQGIPVFGMGMAFGLMYLKTGSLAAPIYMHCVNNLLAVVSYLFPGTEWLTTAVLAAMGVAGWFYLGYRIKDFSLVLNGPNPDQLWKETLSSASFWLLAAAFAASSVLMIFFYSIG